MSELLTRIKAILSTSPQRWTELTAAVPEELLRRRPAPEEWSALECLVHILDTEQVFPRRVVALRFGAEARTDDTLMWRFQHG
ncbi:MAG: DinB family protein [Oscillochloridaceae bacterium umkhey_bin13]